MRRTKPKPIKILHVVGAMNRGGTETMLMNIYRNIDHKKVQFDFISYSQKEADYDQEIKSYHGRIFRLTKTNSIKQIYDVIKKYGPYDVVHAHTLFHCGIAHLAAVLAGVKIRISHSHTTFDESNSILKEIYMKCMRAMILMFSTNLLACSRGAGEYLFGRNSLSKKKYLYFPNIIDYSAFLIPPERDVRKFKVKEGLENSLIIGHIGRFTEAKNHIFLLEIIKAAKRLEETNKTIHLLLVGDGDLRKDIEKKAEKAGLLNNVHFVGKREDISVMLHSMDVFVFPSVYEGLGLVLLEAQASGLPCIVSEAIQPEADLNIGLVTKLSLADGPDIWAKEAIKQLSAKEKDTEKIITSFEQNSYSLKKVISSLMNIYQGTQGGKDEADINCIL